MSNKYKPLSYAVRAQQLLPYISFNKEGETKCVGKVYSCRWSIEAAKDPKCKDNLKEDGLSLLNKNIQDLPPNEYERLEILIRETKEFIAKKAMELFPPAKEDEEYHIDVFKDRGWIQDQENNIKEAALSDDYMINGNDNAYRDHDYKK